MRCLTLILFVFLLNSCGTTSPDFVIIAHRGASAHLPEHSLAATAFAHAHNPDFLEADLVVTKDNQLIVLHDLTLESTTNIAEVFPKRKRRDGKFYAVDFTLKEIQSLDLLERVETNTGETVYSDRYSLGSTGLRIPSFDQFLKLVNSLNRTTKKNIGIYPEIKSPEFHQREGKDITSLVITKLREWGYEEKPSQIFLQSFSPESLMRLKTEFKTQIPLIQLIGENSWNESSADYDVMRTTEGLKKIKQYAVGVGPWLSSLKPELIADFKQAGLQIHPYTHRDDRRPDGMSSDEYIQSLLKLGVDGLFTDHVELFEFLKKKN
jgi:glycerophosphoryl diester phosphodiesterase